MKIESKATDPTGQNSSPKAESLTQDNTTPEYLVPTMGGYQLSEPAYYRSLFILDTIGPDSEQLEELNKPIDPFAVGDQRDLTSLKPAVGVLTVHEQKWRQTGIALGNLLQSVCLAPGEVTQVAVTRWEHKTMGTSSEFIEQREAVSEYAEQNRAVNEVQRAVAHEAQMGRSSVSGRSTSGQGGLGSLLGSASAATTKSSTLTAQFSAGIREVAAESTTAIAQHTAEVSQSLRSRRQSVIREVSEKEAESLSTRVLANYNRRHSMNILFFEVLQKYEVETVLTHWDRCLFVPMVPLDFTDLNVVKTHGAKLLNIFNEIGAKDLIELLGQILSQPGQTSSQPGQTPSQTKEVDDNTETRVKALEEKIGALKEAKQSLFTICEDSKVIMKPWSYTQYWETQFNNRVNELRNDKAYQKICWDCRGALRIIDDFSLVFPSCEWLDPLISVKENELATIKTQRGLKASERLNVHRLFLSQQLLLRMNPYQIFCVLKKYMIENKPLASLVDPQPVGVFGNYIAFRWGFPNTDEGQNDHDEFKKKYLNIEENSQTREVGLPTSGVFSEAVLGQGLAAELIDERFGKWGDEENQIPILPPRIADLQSRDRAKGIDLKGQDFAPSLAQLRSEKLSEVSYIDKVLGQVGKGDMFRDMGGLAQAVTLADKLADLSAEGATKAGERTVQLLSKVLDTFEKVIESDVGQAAVAEFILPGAGHALLGAMDHTSQQPVKSK